jgi:hypothetical protein
MSIAFHSGTHTGVHWHPSGPESFLETDLIEIKEKDKKTQTEIWVWKVHEVALHEANQREGPLTFGGIEPLLKKVSEEVTRKAQEKYRAACGK